MSLAGVRFEVLYPDGRAFRETERPPGNAVRHYPAGAGTLRLVDGNQPIFALDLTGMRPVYYKQRGITLDGTGQVTTDWVVAGRARFTGQGVEAELWTVDEHDGRLGVAVCPSTRIDAIMIFAQVLEVDSHARRGE